ncbi:GumC family protein [Acidisoma sp. 7E03]
MLDDAQGRLQLGRAGGLTDGEPGFAQRPLRAADRQGAPLDWLCGVLARQLWALLLPALLAPALGALAITRMPTLYTATGTILYDPAGYAPEVLQSILKTDPTTDTVVASQAAILGSLGIASRVADVLDLSQAPGFTPPLGLSPGARQGWLDATVMKAIAVAPVGASRVFAVSFTARDPALAAQAANRIMALYLADQLTAKTAALAAADAWMAKRAAELRAKVTAQEAAIARYQEENGLVAGVQARIGTEEISALGEQLMRAENDLAAARARRQVARGGAGSLPEGLISMRLAEAEASAKLDAALARLGPNHPEVRALREQMAALRAAAGTELAAVRAGVSDDADAAAGRLDSLRRNLALLKAEAAREAAAEVPLAAMRQDAEATRGLLQALLSRMDQTAQQAAIQTPDARILSRAEPPVRPSSPRTALLLAASLLAGLVAGAGLAWAREAGGRGFRTEAELRMGLGLETLGAVPQLALRGQALQAEWLRDGGPAANALDQLRGRLRQALGDPRIVMVTSSRPGEGKSTLALALARRAARGGERVLLIDADRLRPRLSALLGAAESAGFAELLIGSAQGSALIRRDVLAPLDLLPAGEGPGGPPVPARLAAAVQAAGWRQRYDLVLIDAPPLLAGADALMLAEIADGILLCLRWCRTPRRLGLHARDLLGGHAARTAAVLTGLRPSARALRGFPEAEMAAAYAAYRRP